MYAKKQVFAGEPLKGRRQTTAVRIEMHFKHLLSQRAFDHISVADLADACGIARSTFYRLYADPVELLWSLALPRLEGAIESALRGDALQFGHELGSLWSVPGLVSALSHSKAASEIRAKLETLVAARLRQRVGSRSVQSCALVMAAAILAMLGRPHITPPNEADLSELMSVIYIAAYLTPDALKAIARDQARRGSSNGFPAAVSIEESLASDDYILSMIDGRPYRSLTRHIARFGMTPADYRRCFGLDDDYPMVAASYSERRRALAINTGFGQRRSGGSQLAA